MLILHPVSGCGGGRVHLAHGLRGEQNGYTAFRCSAAKANGDFMIRYDVTIDFTIALVIGLLLGSFVEYAVHRLMHRGTFLVKRHARHHRNFEAQGWWGEFVSIRWR